MENIREDKRGENVPEDQATALSASITMVFKMAGGLGWSPVRASRPGQALGTLHEGVGVSADPPEGPARHSAQGSAAHENGGSPGGIQEAPPQARVLQRKQRQRDLLPLRAAG